MLTRKFVKFLDLYMYILFSRIIINSVRNTDQRERTKVRDIIHSGYQNISLEVGRPPSKTSIQQMDTFTHIITEWTPRT